MGRLSFKAAIAVALVAAGTATVRGVRRRHAIDGRGRAAADAARARPGIERRVDALLAADDARGEAGADPAARRLPGQPTRSARRASAASSASPTRRRSTSCQHDRGRAVAAAHPDPVRLRHDPRLPDDLPDPARRGEQLRPGVADGRRHVRRARVGGGRPQADLQPDGRRLARAALGPHRRGRGRGPVPRLGHGGGARARPRRAPTTARPTRSSRARSTSPPTASPRAAATTTRPTCPSSGCGTSTCRRSRPRSTRARTPRCARSTRSTACPGCANPDTETDILKNEWGFDGFIESDYTAVAELRACPPVNPNTGPCGHGVAADGPEAAQLALNAGTDSEMV